MSNSSTHKEKDNNNNNTQAGIEKDGSFSSQTVLGSFFSALPKDQLLYYEMYDGNEAPQHNEAKEGAVGLAVIRISNSYWFRLFSLKAKKRLTFSWVGTLNPLGGKKIKKIDERWSKRGEGRERHRC